MSKPLAFSKDATILQTLEVQSEAFVEDSLGINERALSASLIPARRILENASTLEEINNIVLRISASKYVRFVSFTRFGDGFLFSKNRLRFSTFPEAWHAFIEKAHHDRPSPLTVSLMHTSSPQAWPDSYRFMPDYEQMPEKLQAFGLTVNGFSIVLRGASGACFALYCNLECADSEFRYLMAHFAPLLVVMAQQIADRVDTIIGREEAQPDALTHRELDCLLMAAKGFLIKQIAQQLSIAEQTVNFHLLTARTKLKAQNTTHAVALAIGHGLIERTAVLTVDVADGKSKG